MPEDTIENKDTAEKDAAPDYKELLQNLKAETDRKLGNLEANITNALASISHQISAVKAPAKTEEQANYDLLDSEGQQKFISEIKNVVASQTKQNLVEYENNTMQYSKLYSDFPELTDQSTPMSQEVISRYSKLSDAQKANGITYLKGIVYEVANELGIRPSKHRSSDDSFTLTGAKEGKEVSKKSKKEDGVDPGSMLWMEVLSEVGADVDPNNPEHIAKLKKFSQRKSWNKVSSSPAFSRGERKKR